MCECESECESECECVCVSVVGCLNDRDANFTRRCGVIGRAQASRAEFQELSNPSRVKPMTYRADSFLITT